MTKVLTNSIMKMIAAGDAPGQWCAGRGNHWHVRHPQRSVEPSPARGARGRRRLNGGAIVLGSLRLAGR